MSLSLNLSDRVVDIVNEGFDCAVRVGDLPDSSLVSVRLADNRRLCVATPAYLQRAGVPATPADLMRHQCLTLSSDASQTRGWAFVVDGEVTHLRPSGRLDCSDGQVLHDWCLHGLGIAWRSTWEVEARHRQRPPAGGAGGLCRAAQRHLCRVPAAQAPAAARAAVDRLPQAQLRRPALLGAGGACARRQLTPAGADGARRRPAALLASWPLRSSAMHFLMWLVLAAPAQLLVGGRLLAGRRSTTAAALASLSHFFMKLVLAAPASFFFGRPAASQAAAGDRRAGQQAQRQDRRR